MAAHLFKGHTVKKIVSENFEQDVDDIFNTKSEEYSSVSNLSVVMNFGTIYIIPNEKVSKYVTILYEETRIAGLSPGTFQCEVKKNTKISNTYLLSNWSTSEYVYDKKSLTSEVVIESTTDMGKLVNNLLRVSGNRQIVTATTTGRKRYKALQNKFNKNWEKMTVEELDQFLTILKLDLNINVGGKHR